MHKKTAPQSRAKAGARKRPTSRPARTAKGTFPPGVSGNPGGRPRGFASFIREHTRDGEELAELVLRIARGERLEGERRRPSLRMRLEAISWLADRGFGRPRQAIELGRDERGPVAFTMTFGDVESHLERYSDVLETIARPPEAITGTSALATGEGEGE